MQRMQRAMPRAHGEEPEASEAPRPRERGGVWGVLGFGELEAKINVLRGLYIGI